MMNQKDKMAFVLDEVNRLYPNAECELVYKNPFELLIAVVLSAQTTDISVNKVTPLLFTRFPDPLSLSNAKITDVEDCIHSIGLFHNKAKNIIALSKKLVLDFGGNVPCIREELMSLPGVGRKTANVVLAVAYKSPALAVDTHIDRVSKRLGFAKISDDVLQIEKKLMKLIPKIRWAKAHHQLLFFGRYFCKSQKPNCSHCPFQEICKYLK